METGNLRLSGIPSHTKFWIESEQFQGLRKRWVMIQFAGIIARTEFFRFLQRIRFWQTSQTRKKRFGKNSGDGRDKKGLNYLAGNSFITGCSQLVEELECWGRQITVTYAKIKKKPPSMH
ncbi:hypothetical protein AHAS_Ahas12G0185300 [Arachis hypogaea]